MVVVVMGVSGCGKTTVGRGLAVAMGWAFDDADDFHPPANVEKMRRGEPLTDEDRKPWLEALRHRIAEHVARGESAVVACSALTVRIRRLLGVNGTGVRLLYLKGNYPTIHARIAARKDHFMPATLLRSQFELLEEPREGEAIVIPVDPPPEDCVRQAVSMLLASGSERVKKESFPNRMD